MSENVDDNKPPASKMTRMTQERWRKIEEVFERVVDRPPEERAGTLIGLDDTLRGEVEALLARAEGKEDRAAKVVVRAARRMRNPTTEMVGRRLGPYRLIRELGRGGMGTVYLANREDQYHTEVAIKVLLRGLDSTHAQARFRDERQILATLEHPSIVRLLDGGASDDGVPYLVMERIQGVPITKFAADRKLSTEERIELFRQVCTAVQYAHSKAVIHRDLKPSNILVTSDGVPKLLDFGIAKLADSSTGEIKREAETRTGMMMLTPEYASPEQVRGEPVTTASDVYSLGAVLYELLTGAAAHKFEGSGIASLFEAIERVPERPSVVAPLEQRKHLIGDVDNIILKALDKEPHRRYASPEHFSEDLRRHLDGMPVEARAATWTYRAGKFVRRNRLGVGAATLVAVALAAAAVISIQQARRAQAERKVAEQRFEDVRVLAKTFVFEVDDKIANLSGATGARELIVGRALAYLDRLALEATGNVELSRELAAAYMKIGDIQGNPLKPNLGQVERGLASYKKAKDIVQRLAADGHSNAELDFRMQVGMGLLERNHDPAISKRLLSEALELAAPLAPTTELHQQIVEARVGLATLALNDQDAVAMREHAVRCLESASSWSRMAPESPLPRYFIGTAHEMEAFRHALLGDPEGAVKELELAREVFRGLLQQYPSDARYRRELTVVLTMMSGYRSGLGDGDFWQPNLGDLEGAHAVLKEAIVLLKQAVDADPADTRARLDLAIAYVQLGLLSTSSEALTALDEAHALYDRLGEHERKDQFAVEVGWVIACASASPFARARRPAAKVVFERARTLSATSMLPAAPLQCELMIHEARRQLFGAAVASQALVDLGTRLRQKLVEAPDAIGMRIGLTEVLLTQQTLSATCEPAMEAVRVWKAMPGSSTAYTARRLATLEANAHACEENRNRR